MGGLSASLPGARWPLVGVRRVGVALSHGCGRVSSPSRGVRRLAWVRPTVSVPCFGAVVCFGAPCCVVPCFAFCEYWSVLCCGALCSVVRCRAVSCCGVLCRVLAGCAVLFRAASCRVVVCRVVRCLVVVRCMAVRCGTVCRVASCFAVYHCAVVCAGPFSSPFWRGMGSALVTLARFVVQDGGRGYVAGWWLGGAVGCGVAR